MDHFVKPNITITEGATEQKEIQFFYIKKVTIFSRIKVNKSYNLKKNKIK